MMVNIVLYFLLLFVSNSVFAVSYNSTTISHNTQQKNTQKFTAIQANRFHITVDEWKRYQQLMQGPAKYEYPKASPIFVLGVYAKNNEKRSLYAKRMAVQEHDRTAKFLAFNRAYVKAFDKLYSHEEIINLALMPGATPASTVNNSLSGRKRQNSIGDHYILFISTHCSQCVAYYKKVKANQKLLTTIDLYFVGDTKKRIAKWAKHNGILPADIKSGLVTLNIGGAMYEKFQRPALPAGYYFDKSDGVTGYLK